MDDLLTRVLARPSLQQSRLAGAAFRGIFQRSPKEAMSVLSSWSAHPNEYVRIASGIGYGVVGTRDRNALAEILPFVERLANDNDLNVREYGAQTALEQLWLVHTDAVTAEVEQWIRDKNEAVREVVVRTIARMATGGQITRPSVLRHFIERGIGLFDTMVTQSTASEPLRKAIGESINEMGCMAPDLVEPFVLQWADRDDRDSMKLVLEIAALPFGELCERLDIQDLQKRLREGENAILSLTADWTRRGVGRVDYLPLVTTEFLVPQKSANLPWSWIADPYRGCQLRCEFCNARSVTEWAGETAETFARRITLVQNAATVLGQELAQKRVRPRKRNVVGIGVTSDPYQPAEDRFQVTRDLLKTCLAMKHPAVVQTRQELILRDLDVLEAMGRAGLVNVLIALQSPVEGIRNKIELGTSTIAERFRTMRMLSAKGIPVGLLLSPIMPDLTDDESLLDETLRRAADAGAQWVVSEVLNLHGSARTKVKIFLEAYIDTLLPKYREIYTAGKRTGDPDTAYADNLQFDVIPALARKHGLIRVDRMLTGGREAHACLIRR